MGLLEEAKKASMRKNSASLIEGRLNKKDLEDFKAAMADNTITNAALVGVLKARDIHISEASVRRMRVANGN